VSALLAVAGMALRIVDLGRFGFWNDEAWVALTTRVETVSQFRLSVGHTPIGFVQLLRAMPAWASPELTLRLVPLAFGVATMWIAWRLGRRVAGPAGALAGLAAVALDPLEIAFSKQLKQYTAEAFFALAALDALQALVVAPSRSAVRRLAVSLCVGVIFGTAQLFVAGPVLLVALVVVLRAESDVRRTAVVTLAATVAWLVVWYLAMVAPHVTGRLTTFFANDFVPTGSVSDAARFVWAEVAANLGNLLGPRGWLAGVAALVVTSAVRPSFRPVGIAVVLLLLEMIGLGLAGLVPFGATRVMLFAYGAMGASLAIAVASALSFVATGSAGTAVALGLAVALVADATAARDWRHIADSPRVEDVGPLIRTVEAARAPEDVVVLYERSLYVYAYYQRAVPVLAPSLTGTGFAPVVSDPRVRLVNRTTIAAEADRAFADASVVWFVGSRMGVDEPIMERSLQQRGTLVRREARADALLLRLERRSPTAP
jgi:hypothetical protein